MDWKKFFMFNKKTFILRIVLIIIFFSAMYILSMYFTPSGPTPLSESFHLFNAFTMFISSYLIIELGIFLIRLYLFLDFKFKHYFAVSYILIFTLLNIFGVFNGGRNDRYIFYGLFLGTVLFISLIITSFRKYR